MKKWKNVLDLRPTQFSVGMAEVSIKIRTIRKVCKKSKKLKKFLSENPIPVVLSPKRNHYVTDHHHLLWACWAVGVKRVRVEMKENLSKKKWSYVDFWKEMVKRKYTYLYDQFGEGPRPAVYLPQDIRGMADDPYRSLAWIVKKEGGYKNSTKTYSEFAWADFFRKRKMIHNTGRAGLKKAAKKAVPLARSPAAKNLPGYIGKKP